MGSEGLIRNFMWIRRDTTEYSFGTLLEFLNLEFY